MMRPNKYADAGGEIKLALRACWQLLLWAMVFSAGMNLLYLAPSLYMLQIYDRVLQTGGIATLGFLSLILVLALMTLAILDILRTRLFVHASLRVEDQLAARLLEIELRGRAGQRRQIMRSFDQFRQTMAGPAATAIMDAPFALLYVGVCFMIHPLIGSLALGGAILLLLLAFFSDRALQSKLSRITDIAPQVYAAQEVESASGEAVRSLGMQRAIVARQLERRSKLNDVQAAAQFDGTSYSSATKLTRLVLQSAVLGLGAWLAVERQISPGALIAGSILAARALAPLEQIVGAWRQIGEARLSYRMMCDALATAPLEVLRTTLPPPAGALVFEGVRVRQGHQWVLHGVSFSISPGEIIGVIGPSGAGKSTLARIAAGALVPNHGVVRLDKTDLLHWDSDALGRHIGYLPQDTSLIAGSIAENIRRFETIAADTDAEILAASKAAGAHDMILQLPDGYDTQLGPRGSGMSLGQAQRIGLARALYRNPALLVLDEPNAHLDQDGEVSLAAAIRSARHRGAIVLMVAHRKGVLALADRLFVMRDGRIEASGTHDEVRARLPGLIQPRLATTRTGST